MAMKGMIAETYRLPMCPHGAEEQGAARGRAQGPEDHYYPAEGALPPS